MGLGDILVTLGIHSLDKAKPYSPASKTACYILQRKITSSSVQSFC